MDAMGIDHAVVSISPMLFFYWADAAATATLPMQDPAAAVQELERAVRDLVMQGAHIAPFVEQGTLDDPETMTVLKAAERLGVPVILHAYPPGMSSRLEDFYLRNLICHAARRRRKGVQA